MAKKKLTYIIGYSIDACLYARSLANNEQDVIFIRTGPLGYPYDYIGDFITEKDVIKINKQLNEPIQVQPLVNSRYVFFPYDDLKMINSKNGLLSYPLNKLSFESPEELDSVVDCAKNITLFMETVKNSSNYINMYKSFFPKWLYDSIIKYMGVSKWGGLRQSKLTKKALMKELDLSLISGFGTGVIYKPVLTYEEICNELLNSPRIKIDDNEDISNMTKTIKTRFNNADIMFMDNRIDSFIGYHHGALDRIDITSEITSEQGLEEFIDVDDGIVLTPKKPYWCATNKLGVIQKISSELVDITQTHDKKPTILCPTNNNVKMINDYEELLKLYSGKTLNLTKYISSVLL
jgi:hypothetical protein